MKPIFLILILTVCAGRAQMVYPPATQTEVNAGSVANKFVSPKTLSAYPGLGNTNALTPAQSNTLANAASITQLNTTSNSLVTQITTAQTAAQSASDTNGAAAAVKAQIIASNFVPYSAVSSLSVASAATSTTSTTAITALGGWPTQWPGSSITSAVATATSAVSATSATSATYAGTATNAGSYYVTNLTFAASQTNWTITLPAAAANYMVRGELYLYPNSSNPLGTTWSTSSWLNVGLVSGVTYTRSPYSIMGSGQTWTVSLNGDDVQFLDATGQPYTFTAAQAAANLKLKALFTWTVPQ